MSVKLDGGGVWWLYQARRVNTQTNAGGGALTTRFHMNPGQMGQLVHMYVRGSASATAGLAGIVLDEDDAIIVNAFQVAAGVNREVFLPSIGGTAGATGNVTNTQDMLLGPGQIMASSTSVAILNEILTVGIALLLSTPDIPIWDTTGSAGTPSLAASTISAANTLQAVYMP